MKLNELVKKFKKHLIVIPVKTGTHSLLLIAYCLLFVFVSPAVIFAAERPQVMDTIRHAVLAELVRSVSSNVALDGIRILKGFDTLDEDKSYTVGSMVMDGYNGRNKIVYLVYLYDDKQIVC